MKKIFMAICCVLGGFAQVQGVDPLGNPLVRARAQIMHLNQVEEFPGEQDVPEDVRQQEGVYSGVQVANAETFDRGGAQNLYFWSGVDQFRGEFRLIGLRAAETEQAMQALANCEGGVLGVVIRWCELNDSFAAQFQEMVNRNFGLIKVVIKNISGGLTRENSLSILQCLAGTRNVREWDVSVVDIPESQLKIANKCMQDIASLNSKIGPQKNVVNGTIVGSDKYKREKEKVTTWRFWRDDAILSMKGIDVMKKDYYDAVLDELSEEKWGMAVGPLI